MESVKCKKLEVNDSWQWQNIWKRFPFTPWSNHVRVCVFLLCPSWTACVTYNIYMNTKRYLLICYLSLKITAICSLRSTNTLFICLSVVQISVTRTFLWEWLLNANDIHAGPEIILHHLLKPKTIAWFCHLADPRLIKNMAFKFCFSHYAECLHAIVSVANHMHGIMFF